MTNINPIKVLLYIQHLHGVGHAFRATRLAQALRDKNFDVYIAWGGTPVPSIQLDTDKTLFLPSLEYDTKDYYTLLDAKQNRITDAYLNNRQTQLENYCKDLSPNILITETFPFGRRQLRNEITSAIKVTKHQTKPTLIVSSIRDIIQQNRKPKNQQETIDTLKEFYDLILVHGDKNLVRLEETVPGAEELSQITAYTGFIGPQISKPESTKKADILVSVGGGADGLKLIETCIETAEKLKAKNYSWIISTGPYLDEANFNKFKHLETNHLQIVRFIPNLSQLMQTCELSISLAGYNTLCDILSTGCRSILIPSVIGEETEQLFRAKKMQQVKRAEMIHPNDLDSAILKTKINEQLALSKNFPKTNMDGAVNSVRIIEHKYLELFKESDDS